MKVACKNVTCKNYYSLKEGEHCMVEGACEHYSSNRKKSVKKIPRCKECEYCKRVPDAVGANYHWECSKQKKIIFLKDNRICDCKI